MTDRFTYRLMAIKSFYDKKLPIYFHSILPTTTFKIVTLAALLIVTSCAVRSEFKTNSLNNIMSYDVAGLSSEYEFQNPACLSQKKTQITTYEMGDASDGVTYDVPVKYNARVEWYLKYFTGRGFNFFSKWLERSGRYLPTIKTILKEEGVPLDLAYVALIESGFNHKARSHARAVGTWQFIKSTADLYDLRVDWWVDERHDFEKSTRAAARFLKHLYGKFGSWEMALAAYNAGEGRIRKAARINKSNDYWVIAKNRRTLKIETRDYVPKFIAAMMIAKNPKKYGFHNLNYHSPLYYDKVNIKYPTDIKVIAKASGATLSEIKKLNPALKRWYTPETNKKEDSYEIRIPKGTKQTFTKNINLITRDQLLQFHKHKVQEGESLWSIARKYNTQIHRIVKINNLKRKKVLRQGITLMVPVRRDA